MTIESHARKCTSDPMRAHNADCWFETQAAERERCRKCDAPIDDLAEGGTFAEKCHAVGLCEQCFRDAYGDPTYGEVN